MTYCKLNRNSKGCLVVCPTIADILDMYVSMGTAEPAGGPYVIFQQGYSIMCLIWLALQQYAQDILQSTAKHCEET